MEIIPAIDIRDGKCVRLIQGDYGKEIIFGDDPVAMARHWEALGATRLHVVDLDGAREGEPKNLFTVERIVQAVTIPVELGGGIRSLEIARRTLEVGLRWVIVGTAALDAAFAKEIIEALGAAVIAGIDARDGKVATRGWLETSEVKALDLAHEMVAFGVRSIIFTDISSDGMLQGPNVKALKEMIKNVSAAIIASGGIRSLEEIKSLRAAGAAGAIIGMALYTRKLDLQEAMRAAQYD